MKLTERQKEIVDYEGDTVVIANPGTGKTAILAEKFLKLLRSGIMPSQILCLTFTRKAMEEMEDRIVRGIRENGISLNYADLHIHTFHSFAMDQLGLNQIARENLLRYTILRYFRANSVMSYGEEYVIDTIVPKTEEAIRYLKAYGISPDRIDEESLVSAIQEYRAFTREEMQAFSRGFMGAYREYEKIKGTMPDYADLLMKYLSLPKKPRFTHVLVDELQDVNRLEARIAIESGDTIFAVGDRKQAIFGFQGGSVGNFDLFGKAKVFKLEESFRSTDQVLGYARDHYASHTSRKDHLEELADLRSYGGRNGPVPEVVSVANGSVEQAILQLIRRMPQDSGKTAIIARTNGMVTAIARTLENESGEIVAHNVGSGRARKEIIWFLVSLLSQDVELVKKALLGPFSPTPIAQTLSFLTENGYRVTLDSLLTRFPEYASSRNNIRGQTDLLAALDNIVIPIAAPRGREWFNAAISLRSTLEEAIDTVQDLTPEELLRYLMVSGEPDALPDPEGKIVLSTVHKAKGREFQNVIYVPSSGRKNRLFIDSVTEAILAQNGISATGELEEETLRVDFVAMTRAAERLFIVVSDDAQNYLNSHCEIEELSFDAKSISNAYDRYLNAYSSFVSGRPEDANRILKATEKWTLPLVRGHFSSLKRLSYSNLGDSACEYLRGVMLRLRDYAGSLETGKEIHSYAEKISMGQDVLVDEKYSKPASNIKSILKSLNGFKCEATEYPVVIPLSDLMPEYDDIMFKGVIDAVFTDGSKYFILDWKTDRTENYSSDHDVQLEVYRRVYSLQKKVQLSSISAGIGYVYLRGNVNMGVRPPKLHYLMKPDKAFEKFRIKVATLMQWRKDPESFLKDLVSGDCDHEVCRAIRDRYVLESSSQ